MSALPDGVVEIPVDALVDDGRQSLVFVQDKTNPDHFTMRRVQVTHHFDKRVFIRSKEFKVPFTGETQEGSRTLTVPGGTEDLSVGLKVAGRGIAPGSKIVSIGNTGITLFMSEFSPRSDGFSGNHCRNAQRGDGSSSWDGGARC